MASLVTHGAFGKSVCIAFALGVLSTSCRSRLLIGNWAAVSADAPVPPAAPMTSSLVADPSPMAEAGTSLSLVDAGATAQDERVVFQTGFEAGFVDYEQAGGECFASPSSSFMTVGTPLHSGGSAAIFQAGADGTEDGYMAHCVFYGGLPERAFYGAWFYVPDEVTSAAVWAVMHFDGAGADLQHELWDVRLEPVPGGGLRVYVFDYLRMETLRPAAGGDLPIGEWFHLEVEWGRAADATGVFALSVNGTEVVSAVDVVSDDSATSEWYVGNFAAAAIPRPSVVYVDDVTLSTTPQGGLRE